MLFLTIVLYLTWPLAPVRGQCNGCDPVVDTDQGLVRGRETKTNDGSEYYAFKGIPYVDGPLGQPPNFEPPFSAGHYDGIYTVNDSNPTCAPLPPNSRFANGINSLTINIYVPKPWACQNNLTTLPVVVYINGGGAEEVEIHMDNGTYIVVLLSYQLGSKGYIRNSNQIQPNVTDASDPILIYRWLANNIVAFGGDPRRTLPEDDGTMSPMTAIPEATSLPTDETPSDFREGPIFTLNQGEIRGAILSTDEGKRFTGFFAIPYARPPVGELRFKAPVPAQNWTGVFNATRQGPECIQQAVRLALPPITAIGSEDCLTLTVYVPTSVNGNLIRKDLPVLVWIHGGGFMGGNAKLETTGPQRFMNAANMIIVMINYRLGAFGFLSTGDEAASGNWGLLDQALAFEWIRDNIRTFGGDPTRVTIGGESAGGASVSYHMLSPRSAGLFHRVIAESGTALCPYALKRDPLVYARQLATRVLCSRKSTVEMIDCLRRRDAGLITIVGFTTVFQLDSVNIPFAPVVENPDTGLFLTEDPTKLFQEGRFTKVPAILGFTRDEGSVIYTAFVVLFQNINPLFFLITVPYVLRFATHYNTNLIDVSWATRDQYYNIDRSNRTAVARASLDFLSDVALTSWIVQTVDSMAVHNSTVYMYAFNYEGDVLPVNVDGISVVSHAVERLYLFTSAQVGRLSQRDRAFSNNLVRLWCNFVISGNPTPSGSLQWIQTPPNIHRHFDIDAQFSMVDSYEEERMRFWNETVPEIVAGQ